MVAFSFELKALIWPARDDKRWRTREVDVRLIDLLDILIETWTRKLRYSEELIKERKKVVIMKV